MARPIRHVASGRYYMITNRCLMRMFLMRPDEECNRILLGCLARAAEEHDVEIVCFCFLSNHFHLIARFPKLNMAEFMEQLQGQISRRINNHRDRSGTIFPKRYDDEVLLDEETLLEKICYVVNNPVKDGLVLRAADWPGVTSMTWHRSGDELEGKWLNGKKWHNLRRRKGDYDREDAMETHEVPLHLPDALDGNSREARRRALIEMIDEDRKRIWERRGGTEQTPPEILGAETVEKLDWETRPRDYEEFDEENSYSPGSALPSRRRIAWANDFEALRNYEDERREINDDYRRAASLWRSGEGGIDLFPTGTYPPGCRRCVRPPPE